MKKNNKSSKKPSRRNLILIGIVTLALCFIAATMILKVLNQQRDMRELDAAGKDLRLIYDELIELNKDNISSSTFGKECSESSVKYGRGDITCGVYGSIYLFKGVSLDEAAAALVRAVNNNGRNYNIMPSISDTQYHKGVSLRYELGFKEAGCFATYEKNALDDGWHFFFGCNKSVPDFLPGYAIED